MTVINSLRIVFIVLCIFCTGIDLVSLQSLLHYAVLHFTLLHCTVLHCAIRGGAGKSPLASYGNELVQQWQVYSIKTLIQTQDSFG